MSERNASLIEFGGGGCVIDGDRLLSTAGQRQHRHVIPLYTRFFHMSDQDIHFDCSFANQWPAPIVGWKMPENGDCRGVLSLNLGQAILNRVAFRGTQMVPEEARAAAVERAGMERIEAERMAATATGTPQATAMTTEAEQVAEMVAQAKAEAAAAAAEAAEEGAQTAAGSGGSGVRAREYTRKNQYKGARDMHATLGHAAASYTASGRVASGATEGWASAGRKAATLIVALALAAMLLVRLWRVTGGGAAGGLTLHDMLCSGCIRSILERSGVICDTAVIPLRRPRDSQHAPRRHRRR